MVTGESAVGRAREREGRIEQTLCQVLAWLKHRHGLCNTQNYDCHNNVTKTDSGIVIEVSQEVSQQDDVTQPDARNKILVSQQDNGRDIGVSQQDIPTEGGKDNDTSANIMTYCDEGKNDEDDDTHKFEDKDTHKFEDKGIQIMSRDTHRNEDEDTHKSGDEDTQIMSKDTHRNEDEDTHKFEDEDTQIMSKDTHRNDNMKQMRGRHRQVMVSGSNISLGNIKVSKGLNMANKTNRRGRGKSTRGRGFVNSRNIREYMVGQLNSNKVRNGHRTGGGVVGGGEGEEGGGEKVRGDQNTNRNLMRGEKSDQINSS